VASLFRRRGDDTEGGGRESNPVRGAIDEATGHLVLGWFPAVVGSLMISARTVERCAISRGRVTTMVDADRDVAWTMPFADRGGLRSSRLRSSR